MQYQRSDVPYWIPFPVHGDVCLPHLHADLPEDLAGAIIGALSPSNFDLFWKDVTLTTALNSRCLFCGHPATPAELMLHLLEEHDHMLPFQTMIRDMLIPCLVSQAATDTHCNACQLTFPQRPRHCDATDPATLARVHYRTQCPVLAQTVRLIVHGNEWTNGLGRRGRDAAASVSLSQPGASLSIQHGSPIESRPQEAPHLSAGQGGLAALAQSVRLLTQLVLRHDHDLNLLKTQDSWMFFMGASEKGLLPLMMQISQEWKKKMDQQKLQFDRTLMPLRVTLTKLVFTELLQRFTKVLQSGRSSELVKTLMAQEVLLIDHSWPYLRWDATQKKLTVNGHMKSLTMDNIKTILEGVLEHLRTPDSVVRFHALPIQENTKMTPWKFQVPLQNDEMVQEARDVLHLDAGGRPVQAPHSPGFWVDAEIGPGGQSPMEQKQRQGEIEIQESQQGGFFLIPTDMVRRYVQIYVQNNTLVNVSNWCYANSGLSEHTLGTFELDRF